MTEKKRPSSPLITRILLWVVLAALYLPIVVMILGAVWVPEGAERVWTLHWFFEVFRDESLMQALGNSVVVAISASLVATLLGVMAVISLSKLQGAWKASLEGASYLSLIFPEIVFALSLLSLFFILKFPLGLLTVFIAHVSFSLSYVMMTVGARMSSFDTSIEDAARDLGASEARILYTVTLPLLKPAIIGAFSLSFLLSFDDFLITYFVNGVGTDTLPVKLYSAMKMGVSPKLNALSSMMFLLTLVAVTGFFRSKLFRTLFMGKSSENL